MRQCFYKIFFFFALIEFFPASLSATPKSLVSKMASLITKTAGPLVPWAKQFPIESRYLTRTHFIQGEGLTLMSNTGVNHLDMTAGYGSINLGRRYSGVENAVNTQRSSGLLHLQSDVDHPLRHELNSRLLCYSPIENTGRCFFTLGGNNAVEAAYSIVRRAIQKKDPSRGNLIAAISQGYSGASSMLPARITGEADRRSAFSSHCSNSVIHIDHPQAGGVETSSHPMIEKIESIGPEKFTAIHLEGGGYTATSGGYHLSKKYLTELFEYAKKHDIPIVDDETYTGFGRTGDRFGISHSGLKPSIVLGAKAITNGEGSLGYVIISPDFADIYDDEAMDFGLTFFAPLSDSAAAIAVLEAFEKKGDLLYANANLMGDLLKEKIETYLEDTATNAVIRHKGLLMVIELREPSGELWSNDKFAKLKSELADRHQVITMGRKGKLMLTPALTINEDQVEWAASAIQKAILNLEK
ncbi:MAG: aminotransferase class III-fold pyridoxal phosphate-dependent enzyme [Oligoflexales bacterium]